MVDKSVAVYLENVVDLPLEIESVWWDEAEDRVGGKEIGFLLVECINFDQNTFLIIRQYILLSMYTNFSTLCIIWKFDNNWWVSGKIHALILQVLLHVMPDAELDQKLVGLACKRPWVCSPSPAHSFVETWSWNICKAILPLPLIREEQLKLLAKECALSTGKLPRRLAQEQCG